MLRIQHLLVLCLTVQCVCLGRHLRSTSSNDLSGEEVPYFPVSTLYLYSDVHAPPLPLLHSEDWKVRSIVNPYEDAIHFNDEDRTLTYFGQFYKMEEKLTILLEKNENKTVEVSLKLMGRDVQSLLNGVQTCVMKDPLNKNARESDIFADSNIDFCYENAAFSFTHEDPRTQTGSRYFMVRSFVKPNSNGVYSFSIVGTAETSLYLDTYATPLFEVDNSGSYYHTVVMKLDASYHYLEAHVIAHESEHFAVYGSTRKPEGIPYILSWESLFLPMSVLSVDPLPESLHVGNGLWQGHINVKPQMPATFHLTCDHCEGSINNAGDLSVFVKDTCSVSVSVETVQGIVTLPTMTLIGQDMINGTMVSLYSIRDSSLLYQNWIGSLEDVASLDLSSVYENYTSVFSFYAQTTSEGLTSASYSQECSLLIDGISTHTIRNGEELYHHFELTCPENVIPFITFSPEVASPLVTPVSSVRFSVLATRLILNQPVPSICIVNAPEPISSAEFYLPEGLYVDRDHCIQGKPNRVTEMTEYTSIIHYNSQSVSVVISLGVYDEVKEIKNVWFEVNGKVAYDSVKLDFGQHFSIKPLVESSCGFTVNPLSSYPYFVSFDGVYFTGVVTDQWSEPLSVTVCNMKGCSTGTLAIETTFNETAIYFHMEKGSGTVMIRSSMRDVQQDVKEDDYILIGNTEVAFIDLFCEGQEGCAFTVNDGNSSPAYHIPFFTKESKIISFPLPTNSSLYYWDQLKGVEGAALPSLFIGYNGGFQSFATSPSDLELNIDIISLSVYGFADRSGETNVSMALKTSETVVDLNVQYSIKKNEEASGLIPLEFVCYYTHEGTLIPQYSLSGSTIVVKLITPLMPIYTSEIVQIVEVPAGSYTVSIDANYAPTIEVRQHGVVIATRHAGEAEIQFSVGVFVPYSSLPVTEKHSFTFEAAECESVGCWLDVDGDFELLLNGESVVSFNMPHKRRQHLTLPASLLTKGENSITLVLTTIPKQNVLFTLFPILQQQSVQHFGTLYYSSANKVDQSIAGVMAVQDAVYKGQNYGHRFIVQLRYPQSISALTLTGDDELHPADLTVIGIDVSGKNHLLLRMPHHLLFLTNSTFSHVFNSDMTISELHIYIQNEDSSEEQLSPTNFYLKNIQLHSRRLIFCSHDNGARIPVGEWLSTPCASPQQGEILQQCILQGDTAVWGDAHSHCVSSKPSRKQVMLNWEFQFVGLPPTVEVAWYNELSGYMQRQLLAMPESAGQAIAYEKHSGCALPLLSLLNETQYGKAECTRYAIQAVIPAAKRVDLVAAVYMSLISMPLTFCEEYKQYCEWLQSVDVTVYPSFPSVKPSYVVPIVVLVCVIVIMIIVFVLLFKRIGAFNARLEEKKRLLFETNMRVIQQQGMMPQIPMGMNGAYSQSYLTPFGKVNHVNPVRFQQ